jgi:hypothetical protein
MKPADAGQRRIARKLIRLANDEQTRITYSLPEEIVTGKEGGYRYFPVIATRRSDGEQWDYVLSSCYGGTRGWFPAKSTQ